MRMEVLNHIYHQFFFTANSLGRQPTTSQYFQPLTLQTLALAAAAIHRALSEYASGKKATVMFSQDEYRGTFCPSPVINFTPEATALINHTLVGRLLPPAVQLHKDRHSSIPVSAPAPRWALFCFTPLSIPPPPAFHSPQFAPPHLGLDRCVYIEFSTPYPHTPPHPPHI